MIILDNDQEVIYSLKYKKITKMKEAKKGNWVTISIVLNEFEFCKIRFLDHHISFMCIWNDSQKHFSPYFGINFEIKIEFTLL